MAKSSKLTSSFYKQLVTKAGVHLEQPLALHGEGAHRARRACRHFLLPQQSLSQRVLTHVLTGLKAPLYFHLISLPPKELPPDFLPGGG